MLFLGVWSEDLVRTLISVKKSVDEDIQKNKIPRKKMWWSVARKFRVQSHIKIAEEFCEEKWEELVRIYRKNLAKARENCVINWPFFLEMHNSVSSSNTEFIMQTTKRKIKIDDELKTKSKAKKSKNHSSGVDDDSFSDTAIVDNRNLAAAIHELQENQNKLLREIVDNQQKRIDELHQEQLSIKSLLVQLLKKLS